MTAPTRLGTANPKIALHSASGGFYAVVTFPAGLFRGRRPVTGPVLAAAQEAVAAALVLAAPVIARIATPSARADVDDD